MRPGGRLLQKSGYLAHPDDLRFIPSSMYSYVLLPRQEGGAVSRWTGSMRDDGLPLVVDDDAAGRIRLVVHADVSLPTFIYLLLCAVVCLSLPSRVAAVEGAGLFQLLPWGAVSRRGRRGSRVVSTAALGSRLAPRPCRADLTYVAASLAVLLGASRRWFRKPAGRRLGAPLNRFGRMSKLLEGLRKLALVLPRRCHGVGARLGRERARRLSCAAAPIPGTATHPTQGQQARPATRRHSPRL
jgi:hypothetical protein